MYSGEIHFQKDIFKGHTNYIIQSIYFSVSDYCYDQLMLTKFGTCLLPVNHYTIVGDINFVLVLTKKAQWKAQFLSCFGRAFENGRKFYVICKKKPNYCL